MNAPTWLKNAIATPRGFIGKNGELLKAQRMTAAQCDEFNNRKKEEPKVVTLNIETPVPVVSEEPKAESVDYSKMKKDELVTIASEQGIETKGLTKAKIIEALS